MKLFTTAVAGALAVVLAIPLLAEDKVARGKQVYEEQKCKICHSVGGVGNPKGALDAIGSKHDADTLKQWLTNPKDMAQKAGSTRKPPMRSFATLPAGDIGALTAYLCTLKKKGGPPHRG